MILENDERELFFKLNPALLLFVNSKMKVIDRIKTIKQFMDSKADDKYKIREQLYKNINLIDDFVSVNPEKYNKDELSIISSWKNFVKGKFFVYKYLKKYTIFMEAENEYKIYGVYALTNSIDEVVGPHLPKMVETALLPFRDKIVYDGLMSGYHIMFGSGIRNNLNENYQESKIKYGVITSLPFNKNKIHGENDEDKLMFYLKNEKNREYYEHEIEALINKSKKLRIIYYQEMGKIYAKSYKKRLEELGVANVYFGILDGIIIASAKDKNELEKLLIDIVPSNKIDFVYVFHLK